MYIIIIKDTHLNFLHNAILESSVDRVLHQVQGSVVYSNIIYYFAAIIIEQLLELNSIRNILC